MKASVAILLASLAALTAAGQGFVNLDFESATPVPFLVNGTTFTSASSGFPGWVTYFNATPQANVLYNVAYAGSSGISLINQAAGQFGGPISNYTALLQGGVSANAPDVALAQTGLVPAGTMSLHFQAMRTFGTTPFIVSLNGQPLSLFVLGSDQTTFPTLQEFGADISTFAGQTTELRFTQGHGALNGNNLFLDNISFSPNPVPEPGTWALLALGGAALLGLRRRK